MSPALVAAQPGSQERARRLRMQALEAQNALLPYALGFFAFGLAMFAWGASFASNVAWMSVSLAIFAVNWGVFYVLATTVRTDARIRDDVARRTRVHMLGGLLWAGAVAQISGFALHAGPARESLLIMAAGGAAAISFFLAPLLPALLIIAPAAAAGPIIGLFLDPESRDTGVLAGGGLALAMTLSLVVNRLMQRQFRLAIERDALAEACERSRADAEKLARSKSALLSTLSDEVRSGLAGVTHVLAAAAAGPARQAPSREQLNAALGAARDLVDVLDATLDSESAEDGRLTVRAEPFDCARLVRDLVLLNRPIAAAKGLELVGHVDPAAEAGAVVGDSARTRQILANLIGNALKYTHRGRVEVRVRREAEDRLRFEIADTGPGLTREEIDVAFEPFTRIERTAAGSPGAGVGLSLCRRLAGLMGGDVAAESAMGVGSCFWLDLPFKAGETAAKPDASPAGVGPLKVLIADDDQLSAAMLRAVLEELGHHVIHAQSGRRVAELAKICDVDLMICAIADAAAAAKAVRMLRAAPGPAAQAPVLGVIDDAEDAAPRLAAGCNEVMRRPATTASVARALESLTASAKQAA